VTPERLEWLPFSQPPAPAEHPPAEDRATPCPTCGWPVAPEADRCAHCGYALTGHNPTDLLAELQINLPPPVITVTPPPAHWFESPPSDSPALYRLRLQAEQLRLSTGFDRLICLDDISVDHYPHQLEAALQALRDMRGRALLADEVGLGKTIEAGIIMKELIERSLVSRVLILTPAALTWQWREEMDAKFHEAFEVLENLAQLSAARANNSGRWLISLDRAKQAKWSAQLLGREYDLLIIDEAHKLKNHQTDAYRFVSQLRPRYLLLLTATPIHNDLMELYNLTALLRPGYLGTRQAFRQNFMATQAVSPAPPAERRPGQRTIYSHPYPHAYLRKSRPAREQYRQAGQDRWLARRSENMADLAILKLTGRGRRAAAEVNQLLAQGYEVTDFEAIQPRGWFNPPFEFVCRLKLSQAARQAKADAPRPERRAIPRHPAALRGLLREMMIRHRRSRVGVNLPLRQAAIYNLNLTPPERELYDGVTAFIRQQFQTQPHSGSLRMTLLTLQKQLCSSPQAVARTLRQMIGRQPDPRLTEYVALAWSISTGRKIEATLSLLGQYPGKFLVFTDYLPTLQALQESLNQAGIEAVAFHGSLSSAERVEAVRAFRRTARVMVSTQSGSEGHNLQFCHQLINFDLPWNPMRIEQRVGRLHRLGQTETVSIFNLAANQTIEAYILNLLAHKIRMFELVIGELDLILGELDERHSFEQYLETAWAGSQSEAELQNLLTELETAIDQAQATYQQIRDTSDELSDLLDAFGEVYGKL
jgi:superfamily II DNA or RNA helicase